MKRAGQRAKWMVLIITATAALGCGGDGGGTGSDSTDETDGTDKTEATDKTDSTDNTGNTDSTDITDVSKEPWPEDCDVEPTLASLEESYFGKSCNFVTCHGGGGKAGELALDAGTAHAALVGVPAFHAGAKANGKVRVVPGDPDASYLVQRLEAPHDGEGVLMPQGAQEPLDPLCRIRAVREWIAAGAPAK